MNFQVEKHEQKYYYFFIFQPIHELHEWNAWASYDNNLLLPDYKCSWYGTLHHIYVVVWKSSFLTTLPIVDFILSQQLSYTRNKEQRETNFQPATTVFSAVEMFFVFTITLVSMTFMLTLLCG